VGIGSPARAAASPEGGQHVARFAIEIASNESAKRRGGEVEFDPLAVADDSSRPSLHLSCAKTPAPSQTCARSPCA
jgi:hypothetical protein